MIEIDFNIEKKEQSLEKSLTIFDLNDKIKQKINLENFDLHIVDVYFPYKHRPIYTIQIIPNKYADCCDLFDFLNSKLSYNYVKFTPSFAKENSKFILTECRFEQNYYEDVVYCLRLQLI